MLALVVPLLTQGAERAVAGSAGSVTARAAVHTPVAAPDVRFAVGGPAITEARRLAEQHWGTAPCGGNVEIAWASLDADTNATAGWRNPTDAWNNAGENFDCRVEFNAGADYDWPKLCTVMTHELGHLVGQPHSDRPGELMSPIYTDPLPACNGPEPGAPAAAPAPVVEETVVPVAAATKRKPRAAVTRRLGAAKRCTRNFRAKNRKASRCVKPRGSKRRAKARTARR